MVDQCRGTHDKADRDQEYTSQVIRHEPEVKLGKDGNLLVGR